MIPKCRTCAHDTCESYENACEDCAEYSAWKEARFVQEIRKEEREACAKICDKLAEDLAKDQDRHFCYRGIGAAMCAGKIRAEGSGR